MKKMMMLIFFSLITLILTAPANERLIIAVSEPLYIYNVSDPFLRAVMRFESNYDERAVNPITKARGVLQIMPVMIKEVNKYSDVKYTWNDAFNAQKSIEIWHIIHLAKNPEYYYDKACRIWFGIGRQHDGMTWHNYYNKVTENL
jgi:hypothetical protein